MLAIDDQSDAHQLFSDWNHPEPRIAQDDDQRIAGVAAGRAGHVAVVSEEGHFLQRFDIALSAEAIADQRAVAAGIDDESRFEAFARAGLDDSAIRIIELHRGD